MPTQLATEGLHKDDDQPATKHDLRLLKQDIDSRLDALVGEMVRQFDELRRHFDVAVENVKHEMAGANADEISLLKDTGDNHEKRLRIAERKLGLR